MSDLKKGQIVACWDRDDCDKFIGVFIAKEGTLYRCARAESRNLNCELWQCCVPLEEVRPEAFLGCDREIIDSLRQELQRLRRQIRWLCQQLQKIGDRNGEQECPPSPYHDCRRGSCAECWEQASLKAVKEAGDVR